MNLRKGIKGFLKIPLEERFWTKVDKRGDNNCWPWLGTKWMLYGLIWVNGRHRKAHQVSWELKHGIPFPQDKIGCHSCDNPSCVNPNHIWPGTHYENAMDAKRKGRLKFNIMPRKSHCARGHAMTEGNVIKHHQKGRVCRACRDLRNKKRYRASEALQPNPGREEPNAGSSVYTALSPTPTAAYEVERDYSSDDEIWIAGGMDRE